MVFLLVIVLLLFGAKKLPELARGFGKSLGEFKKGREECARDVSSPGIEEAPAKPPHTPA
jgi:TatA/E family protein of Tat protein translocase